MIQSKEELEKWYLNDVDPWAYDSDPDDIIRKSNLLNEIPEKSFKNVLDIGCGNGFITRDLPGKFITGFDISENAINIAKKKNSNPNITYSQKNIFDLFMHEEMYDLIIITGVLYPQYIGNSNNFIYLLIDKILERNGILITVHIDEWYSSRFPLNFLKGSIYKYKTYLHRLEVYQK